MNHCGHEIKELLPLYVDHDLTEEEMLIVENHIKDCEECHIDLELYQSIHDELDLDDIKLPENFHHELMNKLALENETKEINAYQTSFFVKYMRYINLVALFTVVVFIGLAGLNRTSKSDMELATFDTSTTERVATESTNESSANEEVTTSEASTSEEESVEMKSEVAVMQAEETSEEAMLEAPVANEESIAETTTENTAETMQETTADSTADSTAENTQDSMLEAPAVAVEPTLESNEKMMITAEEDMTVDNSINNSESTLTTNGTNATLESENIVNQNWFLWMFGGILVIVLLGSLVVILLIKKKSALNKKS